MDWMLILILSRSSLKIKKWTNDRIKMYTHLQDFYNDPDYLDIFSILFENTLSIGDGNGNGTHPDKSKNTTTHMNESSCMGNIIDQTFLFSMNNKILNDKIHKFYPILCVLLERPRNVMIEMNEIQQRYLVEMVMYTIHELHNVTILMLCFELGYDVNQADYHNGNTLLHIASEQNHLEFCKLLIHYGAHVNAWNRENDTPARIAYDFGHTTLFNYFVSIGADLNL